MKNNLTKIYLTFSVIFLTISCVAFVSLNKKIDSTKKIISENETKWQQEAEKRKNTQLLNDSIKKIQSEKDLLETHFANSSDIVPFLDTLESIAEKGGVKAEVNSVDIPKENDGLIVGMNASGSFENVYKFILLLENSPYELNLISFDAQQQNTPDASGKVSKVPQWNVFLKIKLVSFTQ